MANIRRTRIDKLFIANRGEIACRIIRAAREMRIRTVAAFSEIDSGSLPVRMAEEVALVGPADPLQSYLNIDAVIDAAKRLKCNAIHPGYGFLSENPDFAEKCLKNRIIFIGPSPKNIRELGDKTIAKKIAVEAGIPVIPGSPGPVSTIEEMHRYTKLTGYPCILKAAAGGGGRGMRIVWRPEELERKFASCRTEAIASFGSDAIFLEKYIQSPRHIEIQVLADAYGNVVHLGERDCTIQRRHQKLIEESPSPVITGDMRSILGDAACTLARKVKYLNAGTVEFLLDENGDYYFMEMNTRIQVEHPVTEFVTGVDLVKLQIQIAQGNPLDIKQEDIRIKGHSIECRINAEDPGQNFLPTPGRIEQVVFPLGPGIRVDTAVFAGSNIPKEYDSLIAKLIVHADSRKEAIARMRRALLELKIGGIRSTAGFHFAIMNDSTFESGKYDTGYVDAQLERLNREEFANPKVAAIASAVEAYLRTMKSLPSSGFKPVRQPSGWKRSGRGGGGYTSF